MKIIKGGKFRSRWDVSTWLILGLIACCCIAACVLSEDGIMPVIVSVCVLIFVAMMFRTVYYRIDGNRLIVCQLFTSKSYPIADMTAIRRATTFVSAPATSLKRRIEITFTGAEAGKRISNLVISPVHEQDFINRLLEVNPRILVDLPDGR